MHYLYEKQLIKIEQNNPVPNMTELIYKETNSLENVLDQGVLPQKL